MSEVETPAAPTPTSAAPPETPETPVQPVAAEAAPPSTPPEAAPPKAEAPQERVVPKAADYEAPDYITPQLREFAHKHDFTQEQLNGTLQQMGQMMKTTQKGEQEMLRAQGQQQIRDWGPDAKTNLNLAKQALNYHDTDGVVSELLDKTGYGNSPAVLQFLQRLGSQLEEGGFLKGNVNTPKSKLAERAHRMYPNDAPQ